MRFGHFTPENMEAVDVLNPNTRLPEPKDLGKYKAVISAGSGEFNVTDWPDKIRTRVERLLPFYEAILKNDFPTLSICFGHHVMVKLMGGEVESDMNQGEVGTLPVCLTPEGRKSALFSGITSPFNVVLGHKDSITKLPNQFKLLAYSERCKVQAYQYGRNVFSVQFHPELDLDGLMWRLMLYPEYLQGKTYDQVRAEYSEIPDAPKIISNFHELINGK
jgi:GMP synthase (glutamine-hydrolysing)